MDKSLRQRLRGAAACALCLLSTSCATVYDLNHGYRFESRVYGGTSSDVGLITGDHDGYLSALLIGVADLPFSFIADTIVLPYTVYADLTNEKLQARKSKYKKVPNKE